MATYGLVIFYNCWIVGYTFGLPLDQVSFPEIGSDVKQEWFQAESDDAAMKIAKDYIAKTKAELLKDKINFFNFEAELCSGDGRVGNRLGSTNNILPLMSLNFGCD